MTTTTKTGQPRAMTLERAYEVIDLHATYAEAGEALAAHLEGRLAGTLDDRERDGVQLALIVLADQRCALTLDLAEARRAVGTVETAERACLHCDGLGFTYRGRDGARVRCRFCAGGRVVKARTANDAARDWRGD